MTDNRDATYTTISVLRDHDGSLVWITLNRPETLNALTMEMLDELHDLLDRLMVCKIARVVILRGAGRGFCSGADLKASSFGIGGRQWDGKELANQQYFSAVIRKMRAIPQPIIAAVHGSAAGGGFCFALAADVRIAGKSFKGNAAFLNIGLSGAELGISYFLPALVGQNAANELMLTGDVIHADRALALGLVSDVVDDCQLSDRAHAMAARMLEASPKGLFMTKETIRAMADGMSLEAAVMFEDARQVVMLNDEGTAEYARRAMQRMGRKAKL